MTVQRDVLERHLEELLEPGAFSDYAPNGLQVEGRDTVRHLAVGVSANQALIDRAVEIGADAVLVHHGFFWKGEPRTLVGWRGRRIKALMRHDISLFGYHLPLDAHGSLGNNVGVLRALGAEPAGMFGRAPALGWMGRLTTPLSRSAVSEHIAERIGQKPVTFLHGPESIERVAVVTGGGASFFEQALDAGADLFVTGEPSEQSQGYAQELGGNFVAAGHHATERFGPRAVGDHLSETFGLTVTFIDVPNPV